MDAIMELMTKPSAPEQQKLLAAVRRSKEKIAAAKAEQQRIVTEALNAGISGTEVGAALGVSRHRVYQIRDGK